MKRNYDDPAYKQCRLETLKRDKYRCKMPGCKSTKQLQVHHIKTWSNASALRFDPINCITLCKHCHNSIRGKESHYESLFMEIVHG